MNGFDRGKITETEFTKNDSTDDRLLILFKGIEHLQDSVEGLSERIKCSNNNCAKTREACTNEIAKKYVPKVWFYIFGASVILLIIVSIVDPILAGKIRDTAVNKIIP